MSDPGKEQAFPSLLESKTWQDRDGYNVTGHESSAGLTKRELFAMVAMQGLVSNESWEPNNVPTQTAAEAVAYADALLKELAK